MRETTPGERWHSETVEFDGVSVKVFKGYDGKVVVQIDTPKDKHIAPNEVPVLRVNMNDSRLWQGYDNGSQRFGQQERT